MGKRENTVEIYLDDIVRSIGGITRKWVSPGRRGVPDRIVIIRGLVYFIEVKTTEGLLEPHQLREINKLIKAGASVYAIYGHAGVDSFISQVKEDLETST